MKKAFEKPLPDTEEQARWREVAISDYLSERPDHKAIADCLRKLPFDVMVRMLTVRKAILSRSEQKPEFIICRMCGDVKWLLKVAAMTPCLCNKLQTFGDYISYKQSRRKKRREFEPRYEED
jgi:hypothetical protein